VTISRGARQCFEYLRKRGTRAFPFQETIARELGCKERQVRNYLFELKSAGVLVVKKRQRSSAEYVLDRQLFASLIAGLGAQNCRSDAPHLITELKILERTTQSHPATPGTSVFSESERSAIERAVALTGFQANPSLIAKLKRKAEFYRADGYVIAAHIQRAWSKVERRPTTWPQSEHWFPAVVENALAPTGDTSRYDELEPQTRKNVSAANKPHEERVFSQPAEVCVKTSTSCGSLAAEDSPAPEFRASAPAGYRPIAVSDRPEVRSAVRLRNSVVNGGQPEQSDAHSPDAGGNRAHQGAPGMRVEAPRKPNEFESAIAQLARAKRMGGGP
jgi:hypothetical protein